MAAFIGPAIGAGASLLGGLFSSGAKQPRMKSKRVPRFGPQQEGLINQTASNLQAPYASAISNLQQLLSGSPQASQQFEAPYLRQFHEQTVPGLAELFSGLGAGSQSSSAFQQALGQAGAGLSEQLASLRGNQQSNAMSQLLGFGGLATTPTFETVMSQGQPSGRAQFGAQLGQFGGNLMGSTLGPAFQDLFQRKQSQQFTSGIESILKKYFG